MIRNRTEAEVRNFDLFKLIVLVILILLLTILLILRPFDAPKPAALNATTPTLILHGTSAQLGSGISLSGAAAPGAEVEILVDGQLVGKTTAGNDGKWSFNLPAFQKTGGVQLVARSNGLLSPLGGLTVVGPATAAAPTVIATTAVATTAAATTTATAPTLSLASTSAIVGSGLAMSGTAASGAEVEIVVDGQAVGKTTAGSDGKWSFNLPAFAKAGAIPVLARVGGQSSSPTTVTVTAPTTAGTAAATTVAATTTAAVSPSPSVAITPTLTLPTGVVARAGENYTLRGTALPGSNVEILVNGQPATGISGGALKADTEGKWSFTTVFANPGTYQLIARTVVQAGQPPVNSPPVSLTVETGISGGSLGGGGATATPTATPK